jgi:putative membrane protein
MTSALTPSTRRRWLRWGALGAVVLVPLAFAGLFVGALAQSDNALENIPAAIVNDDTLVYQTAPDGTESPIFAGRLLVTELTSGDGDAGFDWRITNSSDAEEALANGEVYAILTVPSNFSESIMSISGDDPQQADISIHTDDAHSYLTGSVAQAVGSSMVATFGNAITSQYIEGIYSSLGAVGDGFQQSADGATKIADGLDGLTDGLEQYGDGVSTYADGVSQYTGGVDSLSGGLSELATKTKKLGQLSTGVNNYTTGVSGLSAAIAEQVAILQTNPTDPVALGTLSFLSGKLAEASAGGAQLAKGAAGLPALSSGISKISSGASQLAAGSSALRSGSSSLASGADDLADGSGKLADGTHELADGLTEGAESVPSFDDDAIAKTAEVASDPVGLTVTTDNAVTDVGQGIVTFFVPLGLWIGALAVFLVLQPVTRRALTSTANNGRIVYAALARAGIVTAAQAVLLVALMHLALKVDWALLPATLGFSLLMALAFTAFHYLLTVAFGRAGLVVSLFLLAIQVTSTGSLYPIELLAAPFQAVSPVLPLTYAVSGMQVIMSGGDVASIGTAIAALALFGIGSVFIALVALGRTRRAVALGLVPSTT